MSENALYAVEVASINWQQITVKNQEVTSRTVKLAAGELMNIYRTAQAWLDWFMSPHGWTKKDPFGDGSTYEPWKNGKPPVASSGAKYYSSDVQTWETYYNEQNQDWQNVENEMNTPVQALDQHLSSLGNSAQEASQIAGIIGQPNKIVSQLLQSPL